MPATPAQLRATAKWRNNNLEKYRVSVSIASRKHYNSNREKECNRALRIYYFKKECKRMMSILL
jgi:hypothetical protein